MEFDSLTATGDIAKDYAREARKCRKAADKARGMGL